VYFSSFPTTEIETNFENTELYSFNSYCLVCFVLTKYVYYLINSCRFLLDNQTMTEIDSNFKVKFSGNCLSPFCYFLYKCVLLAGPPSQPSNQIKKTGIRLVRMSYGHLILIPQVISIKVGLINTADYLTKL
jgi:hypothetical protein